MSKIITLLLALLCLAGCEPNGTELFGNGGVTAPPEQSPTEEVGQVINKSYDIPDGWEWMDDEHLTAILHETGRGGVNPFVKMEYGGSKPLTAENTAESYVRDNYELYRRDCKFSVNACPGEPQFQEMQLGGKTVYVNMSLGQYYGDPSWDTVLAFEQDGRVVTFWFGDKADLYQDELSIMIGSFKFEKE